MENFIIELEEGKVLVDATSKDYKIGDYLAQYSVGFKDHIKKDGSYSIPPKWYHILVETTTMARFHRLVSKTHKIIESSFPLEGVKLNENL